MSFDSKFSIIVFTIFEQDNLFSNLILGLKGITQQREEQIQQQRYPAKGGLKTTQQREEQIVEQIQQRHPAKGGLKTTQQREEQIQQQEQQQEQIYERKGQTLEHPRKTVQQRIEQVQQQKFAVKRPITQQVQQREEQVQQQVQQREVKQLQEQPKQVDTVLYGTESDWD